MQDGRTIPLQTLSRFATGFLRNRRQVNQSFGQGLQIKASPPQQDGHPAGADRLVDGFQCHVAPQGGRPMHAGIQHAIKAVRHPGHLLVGGPGGEDTQVAVNLHAVGIDHGAAYFLGQA